MKPITGLCPKTVHPTQESGTGPEAQAITPPASGEPLAIITITVFHDLIRETATLNLGPGTIPYTATRAWQRCQNMPGSWKTRDLEWWEHEARLGLEIPEYMDSLGLPTRIADGMPCAMLVEKPAVLKAIDAAQEVGK